MNVISVSDPCQWIYIRIQNPYPDPGGQMTTIFFINFMVWSAGCSLLRAEGFLHRVGRPLWSSWNRKIGVFEKKNWKEIVSVFFQFLVIKTLDPDWIRIGSGSEFSQKCCIRVRIEWIRIRNTECNNENAVHIIQLWPSLSVISQLTHCQGQMIFMVDSA